jgi:DNA-binding transcriptional ArsR family regulator
LQDQCTGRRISARRDDCLTNGLFFLVNGLSRQQIDSEDSQCSLQARPLSDSEGTGPIWDDEKESPKKTASKRRPPARSGPPTSDDIDSELRGKTLKAYLFMMKLSKPVGVRELQRSLELSSPSVAYHHLEKLERLGLVQKDQYGSYTVVRNVDVSVLQAFARVGALLVPRFIFYAMFFTTLLVGYILIFLGNANVYAIIFGASASAFAWFETIRTWRRRPF